MHFTHHPQLAIKGVLRPTHVEVDLTRLIQNFRYIRKQVELVAVMAILKANADSSDFNCAKLRLEHFSEVLKFYEDRDLPMPVRHIANSGAVLQLPASCLDIVRPDILMYGVFPAIISLEPSFCAQKSYLAVKNLYF